MTLPEQIYKAHINESHEAALQAVYNAGAESVFLPSVVALPVPVLTEVVSEPVVVPDPVIAVVADSTPVSFVPEEASTK